MGQNFSYRLLLPSSKTADCFLALAHIADPRSDSMTSLSFGNSHNYLIPFELNSDSLSGKGCSFNISLVFPEDELLKDCADEENPFERQQVLAGIPKRAVGLINLSVNVGRNYVAFELGAVTSHMSMLFRDSKSICKEILNVFYEAEGTFCIFNDGENFYDVATESQEAIDYRSFNRNSSEFPDDLVEYLRSVL